MEILRTSPRKYCAIARDYGERVLNGELPACEFVKLAVRRQNRDLERYSGVKSAYYFDEKEASLVCRFIELLPHTKGQLAGQKIRLEPWQVWILTTIFGWRRRADGGRRFRRVYIEVPRGNGKALALDTEIPTPDGFKLMRDLKVGDLVYGADGKACHVIAATDVMRGRPCYEVEFSTGEVIVADAKHEWVTDSRYDRDRLKGRNNKHIGPKPSVKTTEEIAASVFCRGEHNHRIEVAAPVDGVCHELPIPPYLLGLWLGDGATNSSRFTCSDKDVEIIERIKALGYPVHKVKGSCAWSISTGLKDRDSKTNSFQVQLRRLGVLGNKHIPNAYMNAPFSDRLELLQGLMDTDGFISKGQGQCEFVQKKREIALGVYTLAASLGMRPTIHAKRAFCNGKDCGIVYRVMFHAYREIPVFKLKRKLERLRERPVKRGLQDYRQIVRCDPVQSVPVRCIEVDSPDHCYLVTRGFIRTHNSTLLSGIGLFCLCADHEPGAEVYSFATTRDQAGIVFGDAKRMAQQTPSLCKHFGLEILAHSLYVESTNSTFQAKSAEGSTLDGLNTHLAIIDELHAHKTRAVYDVVETSLGKRKNSLMWVITTAGFDTSGICYEVRTMVREVLEGTVSDETQFGTIYGLDAGDDWKSVEALEKANPNWGVSVMPEMVTSLQKKAVALPSAAGNFQTKHLDVWCSAASSWMNMPEWQKGGDFSLRREDFEGKDCYIGLDLGSKSDMTAKVLLFPQEGEDGKPRYTVFSDFYLPRNAVQNSVNSQYQGWADQGQIHVTEGAMTDYNVVEEDIRDDLSRYNVLGIVYDPWHATQLINDLDDSGAPLVECSVVVANVSSPMKSLEALVLDHRLAHEANPVMDWMMSNVVARVDAKDNIFPRKERYEQKIDGPVALILALFGAESGADEYADFEGSPSGTFLSW